MQEIVYSADPVLRTPSRFMARAIQDLIACREVAWLFFLRNLRSQYRQSALGYLWIILPPLWTTMIWVVLSRSKVISIATTAMPYPVFLLAGTMLWQIFLEALHCSLTQLRNAREILTKVKVSHEAVILAGLASVLFNAAVRALIFVCVLALWRQPFAWGMLLAVPGILALIVLGLSAGLWLAPLGMLYQDVSRGVELILHLAFFVTPIVYPPPAAWSGSLWITLNPVAPLLISTRNWLALGYVAPAPGFGAILLGALLLLALGWLFYRVAAPHVVARL